MNNTWIEELAAQHRETGVLVDAAPLVLWIAGAVDRNLIARHKRLATRYGIEHYDALRLVISRFSRVIVTPHVLTEAIDLARQTGQREQEQLTEAFAQVVSGAGESQKVSETYVPASVLCQRPDFVILGIADTAIIEVARDRGALVLTDDSALLARLDQQKLSSLSILRLEIR
jgi:predicted nucleic acid-binding protein